MNGRAEKDKPSAALELMKKQKFCRTCGGDPLRHDMMCEGIEQPRTEPEEPSHDR